MSTESGRMLFCEKVASDLRKLTCSLCGLLTATFNLLRSSLISGVPPGRASSSRILALSMFSVKALEIGAAEVGDGGVVGWVEGGPGAFCTYSHIQRSL